MVSSSVSPVNTRMVSCFSLAVNVPQDGMSLDTGTFSGSQKLPASRSQTSASFLSCRRFQLIAETRSISFIPSVTRTPLHQDGLSTLRRSQTLPLGYDKATQHKRLCSRVAQQSSFHHPRRALGCRRSSQNQVGGLLRLVPVREVTAVAKPVQGGVRKQLLSVGRFAGRRDAVVAPPADDHLAVRGAGLRPLLFGSMHQGLQRSIKARSLREAAKLLQDQVRREAPRLGGELQ